MASAILSITAAAAERIQYLLSIRSAPALGIRVGIKQGGCSGLEYEFEYADNQNATDEVIQERGVRVFIDQKAVLYLIGTTLDYMDEQVRSGFVFHNPNAKNQCGCGESFNV